MNEVFIMAFIVPKLFEVVVVLSKTFKQVLVQAHVVSVTLFFV